MKIECAIYDDCCDGRQEKLIEFVKAFASDQRIDRDDLIKAVAGGRRVMVEFKPENTLAQAATRSLQAKLLSSYADALRDLPKLVEEKLGDVDGA